MLEVFLQLDGTKLCAIQVETKVECWEVVRGKTSTPTPVGSFPLTSITKQSPYRNPWLIPFHTKESTTFAIHSWDSEVIKGYLSLGCIRMKPEDLQGLIDNYLFNLLIVR